MLRLQDGTDEFDANDLGGGEEGNIGKILEASQAELKFVGNKTSDVVAMPTALRIITGDAKAFTNGLANANTNWSCTGFEDRQLTDKYPICPEGSSVVRTSNFQSCWDGQNIDSANHRDARGLRAGGRHLRQRFPGHPPAPGPPGLRRPGPADPERAGR